MSAYDYFKVTRTGLTPSKAPTEQRFWVDGTWCGKKQQRSGDFARVVRTDAPPAAGVRRAYVVGSANELIAQGEVDIPAVAGCAHPWLDATITVYVRGRPRDLRAKVNVTRQGRMALIIYHTMGLHGATLCERRSKDSE